jgi:hypothetical protein
MHFPGMDQTKSETAGGDPAGRGPTDSEQVGGSRVGKSGDAASIWQLKPWWCQPWSILITGGAIVYLSWLGLHRLWITAPLFGAVLLWWWLFLWLVPASYRQQLEAERQRS